MVLSIIPEEPRNCLHKHSLQRRCTRFLSVHKSAPGRRSPVSSRSTSQTSSWKASKSTPTTDDTLSMISSPWSTETWRSHYTSQQPSFPSVASSSVDPRTTITSSSPTMDVNSNSDGDTLVLLNEKPSIPPSCSVRPLKRDSSSTFSSWSLETYTSTGLLSDVDKVNYPWSPNTFSTTEFLSDYPSTLNLVSQKCSRETMGREKPLGPMNYIVTFDDNPIRDWVLVKQNGILIREKLKKIVKH